MEREITAFLIISWLVCLSPIIFLIILSVAERYPKIRDFVIRNLHIISLLLAIIFIFTVGYILYTDYIEIQDGFDNPY